MKRPLVLTAEETASALGITSEAIPELIKTGILEGFLVGDDYRIRISSVESITGPLAAEFIAQIEESVPLR